MRTALWGLGLTALVSGGAWMVGGSRAIFPAAVFGLLATGLQVIATALLRPALGATFRELIKRWGIGMALRMGGIVVFAAAAWLDRDLFPPLPSALGYVGVIVPLLFMETRLLR